MTDNSPATDELLDRLDKQLAGVPDTAIECISVKHLRSFIARIRAETAKNSGEVSQIDRINAVLSELTFKSNHSRSFGSHADAYEIAARKLRHAIEGTSE